MDKVLIIDDEIKPDDNLGKQIINLCRPYETIFIQNGKDGYNLIVNDNNKEVKLVLLDILFPRQEIQGEALLDKIKNIRVDIPVIVLTKTEFYKGNLYAKKGAWDCIGKDDLLRRTSIVKNILHGLVNDPTNSCYTIGYEIKELKNNLLFIDIFENEVSLLKKRIKSSGKEGVLLKAYLEHFIENRKNNLPRDLDYLCLDDIDNTIVNARDVVDPTYPSKVCHRINNEIKIKSNGKIVRLLEVSEDRMIAYRIIIGDVLKKS